MSQNCDDIVIFRIFANLEQSGGWIPDKESAKIIFPVTVTFFPTKIEKTELKNL